MRSLRGEPDGGTNARTPGPPSSEPPAPRPFEGLAFGAVVAVFAFAFLRVHARAGFGFPVPWPDESSFLWPAIAFQEHTTLFTPELNPERHVLWMPPGYSIALGSIFKLTGFSLEGARMLSALFLLGSLALLASTVRRLKLRWAMLLLLCLVFLGRHFVLMGNFARMEALLVLVFSGAAFALVRGRTAVALGLLLLAPLIHPNGLYPAAAMLAYALAGIAIRRGSARPSRGAVALLVCTALAWIAYAAYVGAHWDAFQNDMRYQVSWKGQPGPLEAAFWSQWAAPERIATAAALLALGGVGVALGSPATPLLVLAVPLHLLPRAPGDWFYEIYRGLVFAFAAILVLDCAGRLLDRAGIRAAARGAFATAAFAAAALAGFALGWVESPSGYPHDLTVAGMRIDPRVPYIDAEDERAVRAFLRAEESTAAPVTVRFFPWADALLFHDLRSEGLRFIHPTFYTARADVSVIHLSSLVPEMRGFFDRERMTRRVADFPRIRARSAGEQWLYERDPVPVTHGRIRPRRGQPAAAAP